MNRSLTQRKASSGISLIEALVSLAVLSFGLLAIASFQGRLVLGSGYNKTRAEAMALAEQKLDDIRSYTTQEQLVAKLKEQAVVAGEVFPEHAFDDVATLPADVVVTACDFTLSPAPYTTVIDASNPLPGTNASFSRQWKYCLVESGLLYTVVEVSWETMEGDTETVSLESAISWKNPAASVNFAEIPEEPQVPSATGRAYLGDGKVTDADLASDDAVDNEDGTFTLYKANDGSDVALVDAATKEIVLTLEDACKLDDPAVNCFEFVKIKGRVYLDKSSNRSASEIYILASDAAYCARVFDTGGVPFAVADLNGDGADYTYFDYTCYLGGGWYGNLGLLLTGNNVTDKDRVCVGDPNDEVGENWKDQELAKRRVYRGMIYERSPADYGRWVTAHDGSSAPVDDGVNLPLYYSKGVADGIMFPDFARTRDPVTLEWVYTLDGSGNKIPIYPGREAGHDYVVISATGQADASNCTTPLTRPDSAVADITGDGVNDAGTLFNGVPTDFVCLNDEYYGGVVTTEPLYDATDPLLDNENDPAFRNYPYLDRFNGDTVDATGHVSSSSPGINTDKKVFGAEGYCPWDPSRPPSNMHLLSGTINNTTASGAYDLQGTKIYTSDGSDDCWFVDGSGNTIVNPSGTSLDYVCRVFEWGDGWTGSTILVPVDTVECSPTVHDYTTALTVDVATSNEDFSCVNLAEVLISGEITVNSGNSLAGSTVTALSENGKEYTCATSPAPIDGDTFSYTCRVMELGLGNGWSGTVTVTDPDAEGSDYSCAPYAWSYLNESGPVTGKDASCTGPIVEEHIKGTIDSSRNDDLTGLTVTATTSAPSPAYVNCAAIDSTVTPIGYDCTVGFDRNGSGWTGTLTITPPDGIWCDDLGETYTTGTEVTTSITRPATDCVVGSPDYIKIQLRMYAYTWASTSSLTVKMIGEDGGVNGTCDVPAVAYPLTKAYNVFTCTTNIKLPPNKRWSGRIEVSAVDPVYDPGYGKTECPVTGFGHPIRYVELVPGSMHVALIGIDYWCSWDVYTNPTYTYVDPVTGDVLTSYPLTYWGGWDGVSTAAP